MCSAQGTTAITIAATTIPATGAYKRIYDAITHSNHPPGERLGGTIKRKPSTSTDYIPILHVLFGNILRAKRHRSPFKDAGCSHT